MPFCWSTWYILRHYPSLLIWHPFAGIGVNVDTNVKINGKIDVKINVKINV